MLIGLPMQVVAPVLGIAAIAMSIAGAVILVRFAASKISRQELKARGIDPLEREHLLEEVQLRLGEIDELKLRVGELEERLDFTERLLAKPREGLSLGPPREE